MSHLLHMHTDICIHTDTQRDTHTNTQEDTQIPICSYAVSSTREDMEMNKTHDKMFLKVQIVE